MNDRKAAASARAMAADRILDCGYGKPRSSIRPTQDNFAAPWLQPQ
jgi:hypothetical protein